MARVRFGDTRNGVTLSDDLSGFVRQAIKAASKGTADLIEEKVEEVAQDVIRDWPVDTGRSRNATEYGLRISNDLRVVAGYIRNETPYVFNISIRAEDAKRDEGRKFKERLVAVRRRGGNKDRHEFIPQQYRKYVHVWTAYVRHPMDHAAGEVAKEVGARIVADLPKAR